MKTTIATLLLVWLCSCVKSAESRPPTAEPTPAPQAKKAPTPGGKVNSPLQGLLVPPSTLGESQTRLEGCLAQAEPSEEGSSRFPPRSTSRSAQSSPPAQVSPMAGGLLITHELAHACCLKATVTSRLEGGQLTVRETLAGSPCRCMCQSTLRTAVGLAPGRYEVSLVQDGLGAAVTVLETEVEVR